MAIGATGDRVEILRMRIASTIPDDPFMRLAACSILEYGISEQSNGKVHFRS
jgi:hypothetical protein